MLLTSTCLFLWLPIYLLDAVLLRSFPDVITANMAADALHRENIEAAVVADDAGGALPMMQVVRGVKLLVAADDERAARAVLEAIDAAPPLEELPPSDATED